MVIVNQAIKQLFNSIKENLPIEVQAINDSIIKVWMVGDNIIECEYKSGLKGVLYKNV